MRLIHKQVYVVLLLAWLAAACAFQPSPTPTVAVLPTPSPVPTPRLTPIVPLPPATGQPPVHIAIPSLRVDVAVKPIGWEVVSTANGRTTEWQVLPHAAGHHLGTANPGEAGNVVISGHNTPGGRVFEGLAVLGYSEGPVPSGTWAYVKSTDGHIYVYELQKKALLPVLGVSAEEQRAYLSYVRPTQEARLTLITCWPLGDTSYRLVVWGPLIGQKE